uniref:SERPIN domain-containing protein n=1 Tax=Meteorus pulchricornis TaxID=51522 RepID=H7CHK0_9HYME|nr:hypothetical protein [Meteorus pulchricornis]
MSSKMFDLPILLILIILVLRSVNADYNFHESNTDIHSDLLGSDILTHMKDHVQFLSLIKCIVDKTVHSETKTLTDDHISLLDTIGTCYVNTSHNIDDDVDDALFKFGMNIIQTVSYANSGVNHQFSPFAAALSIAAMAFGASGETKILFAKMLNLEDYNFVPPSKSSDSVLRIIKSAYQKIYAHSEINDLCFFETMLDLGKFRAIHDYMEIVKSLNISVRELTGNLRMPMISTTSYVEIHDQWDQFSFECIDSVPCEEDVIRKNAIFDGIGYFRTGVLPHIGAKFIQLTLNRDENRNAFILLPQNKNESITNIIRSSLHKLRSDDLFNIGRIELVELSVPEIDGKCRKINIFDYPRENGTFMPERGTFKDAIVFFAPMLYQSLHTSCMTMRSCKTFDFPSCREESMSTLSSNVTVKFTVDEPYFLLIMSEKNIFMSSVQYNV